MFAISPNSELVKGDRPAVWCGTVFALLGFRLSMAIELLDGYPPHPPLI
ncbi:MAG: hypothetical protein KME06_00810 [Kastovskya adunca ATA6-11-RM4]|nr:hypothetical protein [Kastovskya adunca ATA6-11-RM4]